MLSLATAESCTAASAHLLTVLFNSIGEDADCAYQLFHL